MEFKLRFSICLQIVLINHAYAQCIGQPVIQEAMPGCGVFTSPLKVQNTPLPAPSFSVFSDGLVVEGIVGVTGVLPFLGTVSMEGALPSAGHGSVRYNTGNEKVGIVAELPSYQYRYTL
ncbi:chorion class CB protein PC404-like [Danaus plexippus]|uniref:chorion class CB protein PC404-like n=1 Tax=Danaus plexippus TaxID=13037 RepID=UPI002AB1051E|nr:chorion class CB protein PC404-like [Danaus plexippus]